MDSSRAKRNVYICPNLLFCREGLRRPSPWHRDAASPPSNKFELRVSSSFSAHHCSSFKDSPAAFDRVYLLVLFARLRSELREQRGHRPSHRLASVSALSRAYLSLIVQIMKLVSSKKDGTTLLCPLILAPANKRKAPCCRASRFLSAPLAGKPRSLLFNATVFCNYHARAALSAPPCNRSGNAFCPLSRRQ